MYNFLLMFYSNYGRFRDIARYWSKIARFSYRLAVLPRTAGRGCSLWTILLIFGTNVRRSIPYNVMQKYFRELHTVSRD